MENNGVDIVIDNYSNTQIPNQNIIKETVFGNPYPGFGKEAPHIWIEGAAGLKIHNNSFEEGEFGIHLKGVKDFEIFNNSFSDLKTSIKIENSNKLSINNNTFNGGSYGIVLVKCFDFKIYENTFNNTEVPIYTENSTPGKESEIKGNQFKNPKTGVMFKNDNHTELDITCNKFENFTNYAIKSENTMLKDQGSIQMGCGNEFISNSSLLYNCLNHTGPDVKYHFDPMYSASFANPNVMSSTVTKLPASNDKNCLNASFAKTGGVGTALKNTPVKLSDETESNKGNFLIKNIPNPFQNNTTVIYSLNTRETKGMIKLYDVFGNLLKTYQTSEGKNSMEINCSEYPSGVYSYALYVDDTLVDTKMMVILKESFK